MFRWFLNQRTIRKPFEKNRLKGLMKNGMKKKINKYTCTCSSTRDDKSVFKKNRWEQPLLFSVLYFFSFCCLFCRRSTCRFSCDWRALTDQHKTITKYNTLIFSPVGVLYLVQWQLNLSRGCNVSSHVGPSVKQICTLCMLLLLLQRGFIYPKS